MIRERSREADRTLRMENMVEVVPLARLRRSMYRNKRMRSELDYKNSLCQSIEAKVRQTCETAKGAPNSFARFKVVQC